MFIKDGKRFNIYPRYTDPETGEKGIDMTIPANRERFGVTEIPDPVRMPDETHYNQEINEAPYLICTPKPAEMVEAARVAKIDAQIVALERQAIDTGLVRTLIDDLLARSLQLATQAGVTEAELLDPESPNYSRAYAKVHANAAERAALRALR
jgi:hypothetical protein